jgi:hypothetical protein
MFGCNIKLELERGREREVNQGEATARATAPLPPILPPGRVVRRRSPTAASPTAAALGLGEPAAVPLPAREGQPPAAIPVQDRERPPDAVPLPARESFPAPLPYCRRSRVRGARRRSARDEMGRWGDGERRAWEKRGRRGLPELETPPPGGEGRAPVAGGRSRPSSFFCRSC